MKAAALFSGGKESTYALYKALTQGYEVQYLLHNLLDLPRPSPHTVNIRVVEEEARAIGIQLVKTRLERGKEQEQLRALLRKLGVGVLVAGDLYLEDHVKWLLEVCEAVGVKLYEPVWIGDPARSKRILSEEIQCGIQPFICGIDTEYLDTELLGRTINGELAQTIIALSGQRGFDPCGERGEYHTLVLNGPMFKKPISVTSYRRVQSGSYAYLVVEKVE